MKLLIRIGILAVGLGLPLAIVLTHGGRTDAQTIIHGDTLNAQVNVWCNFFATGTDNCLLFSLSSDGTTLTSFAIPSGKTFVLTDMECTLQTSAPGGTATCGLFDPQTACASSGLCETNKITIVQAGATSGTDSLAVVGLHLTTGIPLTFVPQVIFRSSYTNPHANIITLQGYWVPNDTRRGLP
jgi:hypothetical protein